MNARRIVDGWHWYLERETYAAQGYPAELVSAPVACPDCGAMPAITFEPRALRVCFTCSQDPRARRRATAVAEIAPSLEALAGHVHYLTAKIAAYDMHIGAASKDPGYLGSVPNSVLPDLRSHVSQATPNQANR
jgi:hypothetical protein